MQKYKVLIADDHEVVRRGLYSLLADDEEYEICADVDNGRDAVKRAVELRPDVVIIDIGMPLLNGLETTRRIVAELPRTHIVILSIHSSEQLVREALSAGARAYVVKSDSGRDLFRAMKAVRSGNTFFSPNVSQIVVDGFLSAKNSGQEVVTDRLSQREREVLQLLAEGRTNKEIAAMLSVGVKTIETHRLHVMTKLGLRSLSDLIRFAIRNKLVEP